MRKRGAAILVHDAAPIIVHIKSSAAGGVRPGHGPVGRGRKEGPLIIEPRTAVRRTTKDSQLSLRPLVGAREGALEREPKNLGPDAGRFVQRALFHVRQNGGAPAPTLVQVFSG